ncbi:hypothetical protein THOM_0838 [Trachipleistophora hominis]|uniref:Uncharacterized protein n=1 Tax=Trachipleistophora hominis TaxID=72359 RepID=L7JXQ8_TRAHO|nr:hypothetical protein THOM_0838 [Trachipleistophora hominis]
MVMSDSSDIEIVSTKRKDGDVEVVNFGDRKGRVGRKGTALTINLRGRGKRRRSTANDRELDKTGCVEGKKEFKSKNASNKNENNNKDEKDKKQEVNSKEKFNSKDKNINKEVRQRPHVNETVSEQKRTMNSHTDASNSKWRNDSEATENGKMKSNEFITNKTENLQKKNEEDRKIVEQSKRFETSTGVTQEETAKNADLLHSTDQSININMQNTLQAHVQYTPVDHNSYLTQKHLINSKQHTPALTASTSHQEAAILTAPSDHITFTVQHDTNTSTFTLPPSSTLRPVYDQLCKNTPNKIQFGQNFVSRFSSLHVLNIKNGDVLRIVNPTKRCIDDRNESVATRKMVRVNYAVNKSVEIELLEGDDLNALVARVNAVLNDEYRYFVMNGMRCVKNVFEDGDVVDVFR